MSKIEAVRKRRRDRDLRLKIYGWQPGPWTLAPEQATLRDQLAMAVIEFTLADIPVGHEFEKRAANCAYGIADAMLAARKEE